MDSSNVLTTPDQVKEEGNLPPSVDDNLLWPHIFKASLEMKRCLTREKYVLIQGYSTSLNPDEIDIYDACCMAEANFAMSYAVRVLNIQTQGNGLVRSRGWDESRSENLSQSEIDKLAGHFKNTAMEILDPYMPKENSSDPASSPDSVVGSKFTLSAI